MGHSVATSAQELSWTANESWRQHIAFTSKLPRWFWVVWKLSFSRMDPEDIQVIYGVVDNEDFSRMIPVDDLVWHEQYVNGSNFPNDIAILTVSAGLKPGRVF